MRAPRSADGMADGYRATVDVHFFGIELELAGDRDGGNGKCFVQLDEIHILVAIPAGLPQQFLYGIDWRHHYPLGLDAADGLRDDAGHGLFAEALRVAFTGDHQSGGTIIGARSVAGSYRSVFLECRLQFARALPWKCLRAAIRRI